MFKSIYKFPKHITVAGSDYNITTSYRAVFQWFKLIDNPYLDMEYKLNGTLIIFFHKNVPDNVFDAFDGIQNFLMCGESNIASTDSQKLYDFDRDYLYIWSAFIDQYGIDLNKNLTMHWWEFKSRFDELSDKTKIKQIIQIRAMDLPDPSNQKYYLEIVKLKEQFKL